MLWMWQVEEKVAKVGPEFKSQYLSPQKKSQETKHMNFTNREGKRK
jgi:hypothetical protein